MPKTFQVSFEKKVEKAFFNKHLFLENNLKTFQKGFSKGFSCLKPHQIFFENKISHPIKKE
jgi:hypothetical protein